MFYGYLKNYETQRLKCQEDIKSILKFGVGMNDIYVDDGGNYKDMHELNLYNLFSIVKEDDVVITDRLQTLPDSLIYYLYLIGAKVCLLNDNKKHIDIKVYDNPKVSESGDVFFERNKRNLTEKELDKFIVSKHDISKMSPLLSKFGNIAEVLL